ncbi:transposase [Kitasatospora sp. NPDC088351]|uniref:transposase n=1 Tax=Kitasatospora sp. NPDC088351 TaxID=3155180 RepID=UPI003443A1E9
MVDLAGHPDGTRAIVRRERPHPGAQLSLFDLDEGMRHQVFLADTPAAGGGSPQHPEVRHRAHAGVEDHILPQTPSGGTPSGKTTGFGRLSSRHFAINAAWPELSLTAVDLLARARTLLLDGEPATAEPKKLRYRILHTAARITRAARRIRLRIASAWPWRHELTLAFARLAARPRPVT